MAGCEPWVPGARPGVRRGYYSWFPHPAGCAGTRVCLPCQPIRCRPLAEDRLSERVKLIVGWTGHRPELFRDPQQAQAALERRAAGLVRESVDLHFVMGGQRGVDLWAGRFASAEGIPFDLILPVSASVFVSGWPEEDRRLLDRLVSRAERTEVVDWEAQQGPLAFDRRNERVAARCERLEVVWTGLRSGGTFYTLCAAWERGIPVGLIDLDRSDIEPVGRGS